MSPKIDYAGGPFTGAAPTMTIESTSIDDITEDHPLKIYSTHLYFATSFPLTNFINTGPIVVNVVGSCATTPVEVEESGIDLSADLYGRTESCARGNNCEFLSISHDDANCAFSGDYTIKFYYPAG